MKKEDSSAVAIQPLTNDHSHSSTANILLSPSIDQCILEEGRNRCVCVWVQAVWLTLLTSTGRVRKLEDMSHTRGTSPTSGTVGNSIPGEKNQPLHSITPFLSTSPPPPLTMNSLIVAVVHVCRIWGQFPFTLVSNIDVFRCWRQHSVHLNKFLCLFSSLC